ncbi:MAG: hypothetical protein ACRDBM_11980, partial [Sporomusa sp.]
MAEKIIWAKLKTVISAAAGIGVFGLNSFILLLLKNQADTSLGYVICTITVTYIAVLIAQNKLLSITTEKLCEVKAKTRLVFRWVYVAVYLTIIIAI